MLFHNALTVQINETFHEKGVKINMKINIAICTSDEKYSEKLVGYFQAHYYDKFSWNVFTQVSFLMVFLRQKDVDIILFDKEMEHDVKEIIQESEKRLWAYLVDDKNEEVVMEFDKIEKYTRADNIYRQLLELYSHISNAHYHNTAIVNDKTEIYAFVSSNGGCGTSTIAYAMAEHYAKYEKVLYLNLEDFGITDLVYGVEDGGFDEILFALKSRRKTLELKLAGSVRRDNSGVYFFSASRNALDLKEITQIELKELLLGIQNLREYDKVILDVGSGLGEKEIAVMGYANRNVVVIEKQEICEKKMEKYLRALEAVEEQKKTDICSKMVIFYNKVIKTHTLPEHLHHIRVLGGFPRLENGSYEGIVKRIAGMELFHKIK